MATERVLNFGAGPAALPEDVLSEARQDLLCYPGAGVSVMEMSHRSAPYEAIHNQAIADLKELLGIPENYSVLLMQGGGTTQFSAVCMNLLRRTGADGGLKAAYAVTGSWSKKAAEEATRYCEVVKVCDGSQTGYKYIPPFDSWKTVPSDAAYLYLCSNETVCGIEFASDELPESLQESTTGVPIVADMSSNFLSREINVSQYGLIYAGAQKNSGIAGVTVVIIRDDLINIEPLSTTPTMLRYDIMKASNSLHNTPPTWSIYVAGLIYKWLLKQGGISTIEQANSKKSWLLYEVIDAHALYEGTVTEKCSRSRINVTFRFKGTKEEGDELKKQFLAKAKQMGMIGLSGHRSVGGLRASLYNAIDLEAAKKLAQFMTKFAETADA